jgi:hypothetical protein
MQDFLRPASVRVRCQLVNHAAAASAALTQITALFSRAVKIPFLIEDQAGNKRCDPPKNRALNPLVCELPRRCILLVSKKAAVVRLSNSLWPVTSSESRRIPTP